MDKFKLTVTFSDGEVATEKFCTERGVEGAIKAWKSIEADDQKNGETYSITGFEVEELHPAEELV